MQPTVQAYKEIQDAFDHFNAALFSEAIDEIALNPSYFAVVPLVEIMQTLVHEMVSCVAISLR
nr:hypothetical protein [Morganella morganii]